MEVCNDDQSEAIGNILPNLSELRIIGDDNVLSKVFIDEALMCASPMEAHVYDVLISSGKSLPCFYCGDTQEGNMFSKLTDESYPLCKSCQRAGRGAGSRRKSRVVKPKPMKQKKPTRKILKQKKKQLID